MNDLQERIKFVKLGSIIYIYIYICVCVCVNIPNYESFVF